MLWLPPVDFQVALQAFGVAPYQTRCIQQTYKDAEFLRMALVGGVDRHAPCHEGRS